MGKKNRKGRGAGVNAENESGMPRSIRRECLEMTNILLDRCSVPFGVRGDEWNDFMEVYQLVEKLRKKQQNYILEGLHRVNHFEAFIDWLKEEGVDTTAIEIANFSGEGWGLKALRDIEMAELFLCIPRKLMLTTESAETSVLGGLLKEDRILQNMSNVVLALHLLCERSSPTSFWKPYINILPSYYTTPLYFTPEEILLLKGSPVYGEVLNQFRNITRQYAYFFKLFQGYTDASNLPIKNFCFEDYRWAVSTVMTRQNQLPSKDGQQTIFGLIPLWDMCNHSNGPLTTDFSLQKDCSECFALREFSAGQQVYIYYGSRSNGDLLLHNGFVYPDNEVDRLGIKLGISKNDQLYSMKAEVLARLSLLPARTFYLHTGEDTVDSDTLAYLRVFAMDHDSLKVRLTGEDAKQLVQRLKDFTYIVSFAVESRAWNFLHTRCQLLLHAYPTSLEEDEKLLSGSLTEKQQLCIQLRVCEKRVLLKTQQFAIRLQEQVHSMLEKQQKEQDKITSEGGKPKDPALLKGEQTVDELLKQLEGGMQSVTNPTPEKIVDTIDEPESKNAKVAGTTEKSADIENTPVENGDGANVEEKDRDSKLQSKITEPIKSAVVKEDEKSSEMTQNAKENAEVANSEVKIVDATSVKSIDSAKVQDVIVDTAKVQGENVDTKKLVKENVVKSVEEEEEEDRKLCEEILNIELTENAQPKFEEL